jgi:hypothetical protein
MSARLKQVALIAALGFAAPGPAQTTPPATAPRNNIDERVRQQVRPTDREREEIMLTGDTDIVLTRRTRLFTVNGSIGVSGTSNAFLAPTDRLSDDFGQTQITLGIGTRIGGRIDLFASAGVTGVRYFRYKALDYNALTGLVGARAAFGRLDVTATYQPSIVLSSDFGARQLTSHRFKLSASLPFQIRNLTVEPSVAVERVLSSPSDYRAWGGSAGLTLSAPLSNHIPLLAYVSAQYERRSFDAYFPDLVGVKRLDDNWSAGAGVVWRPKRWGEVRASYSFQRNYSTSDVNAYYAHSGTLGISAMLRF